MTKAEADELLTAVLNSLWRKHRRPILGSQLKAALLEQARKADVEFDERALGYKSFADYLRNNLAVAVETRPGSDLVVSPAHEQTSPRGPQALWIRPDIWRAFVSFPREGEYRGYDASSDKVYRGPEINAPAGALPIVPVPKGLQLEWRREFIRSAGQGSSLEGVNLESVSAFRDFSAKIRARPDLQQAWNVTFSNHVADYIRTWSETHGLPADRWLVQEQRLPRDVRREIYNMLDSLSVEELLELKVPLKWFLRKE